MTIKGKGISSKTHPLPVKEQCIKAVLEQGRTSLDVAREYGIASRTIRNWVQQTGMTLARIGQEKMEECAELALEYLGKNLQTLNQQAVMLGDTKWLISADPERINAIAVSHGILADKSFRLLEAAQRATERQQAAQLEANSAPLALPGATADQDGSGTI